MGQFTEMSMQTATAKGKRKVAPRANHIYFTSIRAVV